MMGRVIGFFFILLGLVGLGASMADRFAIEALFASRTDEPAAVAEDDNASTEQVPETGTVTSASSNSAIERGEATIITELESGDVNVFQNEERASPASLPWIDIAAGNDFFNEDSDHVSFVLTLSEPVERPIIIIFSTVDGTARSDEDYLGQRGTVTFKPGIVSAEIRTPLVDDKIKEGNEQFALALNGSPGIVNLRSRRAVAIIKDDD